jgi:hypothetical protein
MKWGNNLNMADSLVASDHVPISDTSIMIVMWPLTQTVSPTPSHLDLDLAPKSTRQIETEPPLGTQFPSVPVASNMHDRTMIPKDHYLSPPIAAARDGEDNQDQCYSTFVGPTRCW